MAKEKGSAQDKSTAELQKKIIENLVDLQKVHINMADKFDKLAREISNLLNLFEVAARSFAQQPANVNNQKDKDFLDKIDRLLEQNKTIAKGLTLMEDRMRERIYGHPQQRHPQHQERREMPERSEKIEEKKSSEEEKIQVNSRPLPRL